MIVIQRRYNFNDWEKIAVYKDGELTGDEDFVEAFEYLFKEPIDEDEILNSIDGPNLVASIPEEGEEEGREYFQ